MNCWYRFDYTDSSDKGIGRPRKLPRNEHWRKDITLSFGVVSIALINIDPRK